MDRPDMVKRVLLGRGTVASMGMIEPPDSQWVPKDLPAYGHDPVKAAALLDQVGLKLGSDGLRHLPNGDVFRPEMLVSNTLTTSAAVVQEYLRTVGIEVTVKSLDRQTLNAATTKANYDLALMSYGISWDPEIARDNLSSRATDTWWKVQGWNNTRFDDLMDLQATQLDQNQRIQTTYALERIVADEVPIVALVTPKRMALFDKTVMSSWYYTVGGGPIYPFLVNRLTFVGEKGNS
jgi:peptide/nickel transport system substrate-binding protein